MPKSAKVLQFPRRQAMLLSSADALERATDYLAAPFEEREPDHIAAILGNPDTLMAVCSLLKDRRDSKPAEVLAESLRIHDWLTSSEGRFPSGSTAVFDEPDYLLGEASFLVGTSYRLLGKKDPAKRWLDRAEHCYRHTLNPGPLLANVAYARLALRHDDGKYTEVLESLPSVITSFKRFGMSREWLKGQIFLSMTLKMSGRVEGALAVLEETRRVDGLEQESALFGRLLIELGDIYQMESRFEEAMAAYQIALPLLQQANLGVSLADLKTVFGATLRHLNRNEDALNAFRSAKEGYSGLEMSTKAAYLGVLCAETLLSLDRAREAEWEILAALPTIEEQKMVPEGFAAVALLKESVRRRRTDPNALRELREHLQASK